MAKIGDTVRFLNTTGGGRIVRIDGAVAYVDDDGFDVPVLLKECVVVATAADSAAKTKAKAKPSAVAASLVSVAPQPAAKPAPAAPQRPDFEAQMPEIAPFVETAQGERLNVALAFAPRDPKVLSRGTFEAYLVNDSNYCLYATVLTRSAASGLWTARYAALAEPDTVDLACEIESTELADIDRLAVQLAPFKVGKPFELKPTTCVEHKVDATKFFKAHCYLKSIYFDEPVLTFAIMHNDVPERPLHVDARSLETAMAQKAAADSKPATQRKQPKKAADEPLVIDLHIAELVDSTAGLSNADMLNLQIDTFRKVMDQNRRNAGMKIVFIHGKGNGVLRQAILKELAYRYKSCDAQDASFRQYGFGATQVTIR